eukprot:CAMPEP_0206550878 /NCGR_PEP_ID=MMETSP0325_2-20121206/15227_1 /ASSEMBLY_ACC=CAM_ASM_000347 /TAXON_ID=2866 /ORGANISM="Crypthecodinium cohnii, Strain Seligo" /LENGTH=32 /DNA_ID= /DNA_START= /DNA_END= /DNA_ORIENTATION=
MANPHNAEIRSAPPAAATRQMASDLQSGSKDS